VKGAKLLRKLQ